MSGRISASLGANPGTFELRATNGFAWHGCTASARFDLDGATMRLDLGHRSARIARRGDGGFSATSSEPLSGVTLSLELREIGEALVVSGALENRGRAAVSLREIRPLTTARGLGSATQSAGLHIPGGPWRARAFKHGWSVASAAGWVDLTEGDRVLEPRVPPALVPRWLDWMSRDANQTTAPERGRTTSEGVLAIADRPGGTALLLGALGFRRAFTSLVIDAATGELSVVQWFDGAELLPGGRLELEEICVMAGDSAETLLERWAERVGERNGARLPRSRRVAWATWYAGAYTGLDQRWVEERVRSLVAARAPVDTVIVDDGYQAAHGDWLEPTPRLPSGLRGLAEMIRAAGFAPGLWIAPFSVAARSRIAREHPDWLVRDSRGRPLKTAMILSYGRPTPTYSLDTSRPDVHDHLESLVARLVEAGFELIKIDFLTAGAAPGVRFDRRATRAVAYQAGMRALRSGAGDATLLSAIAPLLANVGWVDLQRLSPDTAYGKNRWLTPMQRWLNERSSPSIRNNVATTLARAFLGGRVFGADPDAIVLEDLSAPLERLLTVVNVLSGDLLSLGHDFAKSTPDLGELEQLLALGRGRIRVVDGGEPDGIARELSFDAASRRHFRARLNPTPQGETWKPEVAADFFPAGSTNPFERESFIPPFGLRLVEVTSDAAAASATVPRDRSESPARAARDPALRSKQSS